MRVKIAIAVISATSIAACASANAASPYLEAQLGYTFIEDVDTKPISLNGSGGGFTSTGSATATLEYDNAFTFGGEVGFKDVVGKNFRLGLGYSQFEAKFDKATVSGSGSISDGVTTVNFSGSAPITRSDVASVGASLDNTIRYYSVNAYYDFDFFGENTRPFLGVGVGIADIENAKNTTLGASLHVGVQHHINQNVYVGLKGTYTRVNGFDDEIGLKYESTGVTQVMVTVGYNF